MVCLVVDSGLACGCVLLLFVVMLFGFVVGLVVALSFLVC